MFKDHLLAWVHDYLYVMHSKSRADEILDDIDRQSIMYQIKPKEKLNIGFAIAPPFSGLCCFPKGHGFKQWTGDDSKALMKVTYQAISVVSGLNMCENSGVLASNTGARSMSYGLCNSGFS